MTCTTCNTIQYAANDIAYLHLFGICWDCDKEKAEKGLITMAKFEEKEKQADQYTKPNKQKIYDTRVKV